MTTLQRNMTADEFTHWLASQPKLQSLVDIGLRDAVDGHACIHPAAAGYRPVVESTSNDGLDKEAARLLVRWLLHGEDPPQLHDLRAAVPSREGV